MRARPMVVLLTHCHLDHCRQASVFQENQTMPACIALRSDTGPDGPFMAIIPENWSGLQSPHQVRVIEAFARRFRIAGMILEKESATFRLASVPALT